MLIFKVAKLAGGLRLLLMESAPLVAGFIGLLGARTAAYLVGFGLGSIGAGWLAIIATLISVTGFFNAGANNTQCEAYRAQMRAIDNANRVAMAAYQATYKSYIDGPYQNYLIQLNQFTAQAHSTAASACASLPYSEVRLFCDYHIGGGCSYGTVYPRSACEYDKFNQIMASAPSSNFPLPPQFQSYPACSSPNCPPGKKVWTQVLWGSPTGNFVDSKGCFIVAYSQDAPTISANIEYNPFLPKDFVRSRAISYYLVDGDRFRGLVDNDWKNLESVSGWDKGYWRAEQTDSECRGWRPGWSRKIK